MPLKSLRILDLSRLLPGPYCSMFFSDFGADVIKVEEPGLGDYVRWFEPKVDENSAIFHSLNRNKKGITLNLKSEKGKELFKQLAKTADIVIESFRPGVMAKLGLDYENLKKINKKLIYCAITGYGQEGPYSQMAGHDINYLSYAGLLGLQGDFKGPPKLSSVQIADIGGGAQMAVIGILVALHARNVTGEGQFVDISMTDGVLSWMQSIFPDYFTNQKFPERGKLRTGGGKACYYIYETSDQRYLSVGALEEKFWKVFCHVIGVPHLIPRLNDDFEGQQKMIEEIGLVIKKKTLPEWISLFEGKDACVSPVLNLDEVLDDPQVQYRQMFIEPELESKTIRHIDVPIRLSSTPGRVKNSAPGIGEHNEEVFLELGYSNEDIAGWKKQGIM
ncbi:CoA transferase [Bacillus sp. FJAT-29953]|nr:CoA transferase [Bacillus sp. FJAT-29953]